MPRRKVNKSTIGTEPEQEEVAVIRTAVPENEVERFMLMTWCFAKTVGVDEIPEICHYIELLGQVCERHVFEKDCGKSLAKVGENEDRKRFIVIFKARYLQAFDMDYTRKITPVDSKVLGNLVKVLHEMAMTPDEFLRWVFEEFLEENPKFCPPALKFLSSAFVIDRFKYEYKDKIKDQHQLQLRVKEGLDLIVRSRAMLRGDVSEKQLKIVKNLLQSYREERIMIVDFRNAVIAMEQGNWQELGKYEVEYGKG